VIGAVTGVTWPGGVSLVMAGAVVGVTWLGGAWLGMASVVAGTGVAWPAVCAKAFCWSIQY